MKKTILLLVLVGVALAACKKDNDEPYQFKSTEMVYLNGIEQPKFKSTATQHSLYEIVRNETVVLKYAKGSDDGWTRFFTTEMRDTINNRFMFASTDILTDDGRLLYDFIGSCNFHLMFEHGDTCGYIPQSVIDNARVQIESLYEQEKYDEIYELFHTAFVFYPCTGEEYKQIVANGGN